ncbi:putative 18 kDa antigen 2 [uncultured Desulfatiglans sp.]|uniref:Putative 18 kDa antigen 2 n=1 Tax=Uncultured Desulfatiglans sp. TaxID=1748965 RepID=A0A653AC32_UNCDX|nr:putative 18 kDa antigen 2 [uncultured Desulfatiglans sp.]
MLELTVWKNQQLDDLRRDIDRLFDRIWADFGISLLPGEFVRGPAVHMAENATTLIVQVELPGADPDSLRLSVMKNVLLVQGEKPAPFARSAGRDRAVENVFTPFARRIQLPCRVIEDEVEATFADGILRVVLPKQLKARSSSIRITVA